MSRFPQRFHSRPRRLSGLGMTKCQYMRRRMTQTFDIRHLRAHLRSFAFLIHEKPVKLTTKLTKDTKNLLAASARTGCHTIVTWQRSCLFCSFCGQHCTYESRGAFSSRDRRVTTRPRQFSFPGSENGEKMYVLLEGEMEI